MQRVTFAIQSLGWP